jgi:hypothetical protein
MDSLDRPQSHEACGRENGGYNKAPLSSPLRKSRQIQSSWFPLYDRNPQTFVPNIFWAKPDEYRKATQRISHTPGQAAFYQSAARCDPVTNKKFRDGVDQVLPHLKNIAIGPVG